MNTTQSKQNFTAIAIGIIIALLALNAYQWYVNSKLSSTNQTQKSEMVELQKVQEELTEYAISKYREEMKKKIDANPEQFIKVQENNNGQSNES